MKQDLEKTKQIAQKLVENKGSTPLAILEQSIDTNEKLDTILDAILALPPVEIPDPIETDLSKTNELLTEITAELKKKEVPEEVTYSIDDETRAKLKGEKGDTPTIEELLALIEELIPEAIPGPAGYTPEKGKDYFDGKNGSPDTGEEIIKKINTEGKEKIDASRIKNLPKFTREIIKEIGAHGGAYETPVKGGTNITVRKDASGAWVISSTSGGSGLTKEMPTGTIDDSNVTFTVVHEPFFINVNGAIYNVGDGAYASYVAGTITLNYPVGTGGFIKSYY